MNIKLLLESVSSHSAIIKVIAKGQYLLVHVEDISTGSPHRAVGVAIYKRNDYAYTSISVQFELTALHQIKRTAMSHVENIVKGRNLPTSLNSFHSRSRCITEFYNDLVYLRLDV